MSLDDNEVPEETQEEIMRAVYDALREYGYADLTMQKIAEMTDKCKATIHYHYNTKEELLISFLDYLVSNFRDWTVKENADPLEKLNSLLDKMIFGGTNTSIEEHIDIHRALIELRSQAPYKEEIQEQTTRNEKHIRTVIADIIKEGIDQGVFRDVEPEKIAAMIFASLDGARIRRITTNEDFALEQIREALDDYINEFVLKN